MEAAKVCFMSDETEHVTVRLKRLRERAGLTMIEMAKAMGLKSRSSYQRYENEETYKRPELNLVIVRQLIPVMTGKGDPPITKEEIMSLAGAIPGGTEFQTVALTLLPILGVVAAGVWLENDAEPEKFEAIPIAHDPRFAARHQFGVKVRGTSINKIAEDGDVLICISTDQTALEPKEGDLVIVRRVRHQGELIETTAKHIHKINGAFELWPASTDFKHQEPIIVPEDGGQDGDEVIQIAAVVTGIYRPIRKPE